MLDDGTLVHKQQEMMHHRSYAHVMHIEEFQTDDVFMICSYLRLQHWQIGLVDIIINSSLLIRINSSINNLLAS